MLPSGYTEAQLIKDYTHCVQLSGGESLVFNLITGLGWRGPARQRVVAERLVAGSNADRPAAEVLDELEAEFEKGRRPMSFQLIPTYGCNFKCAYCYEGSLTSEQYQWSDADIEEVVSACTRLAKDSGKTLGECKFTVLGGEVIRESTFGAVESLVAGLKRGGGRTFEAVTNGYELASHAPKMKELGIGNVQITVDGPKEVHDKRRPIRIHRGSSFDRILEGVEACLSLQMTVYLRINIDQRNIRALRDLSRDFERRGWFENPRFHPYLAPLERDFSGKMRFAAEHEMAQMVAEAADEEPLIHRFYWGFHGLSFLYALRAGRAPEPVMRYCGATTGDYVLDARGHVHACWFGAGQDAFELGDISQVAAGLPFDARGRKRVARWRSRGVTRVEPCSTCKWALVCGGGCAFKSRAKTGDMMQPNCAPFTEIFDAVGKAVLEAPPEHWHDRGARSGPKGQLGIEVHTASRGLR